MNTPVAPDIDTDTLTGLEFRAELPCEAVSHGPWECAGHAVWVQCTRCPTCDRAVTLLVCEPKRRALTASRNIVCTSAAGGCGVAAPAAEWVLRYFPIVEAV